MDVLSEWPEERVNRASTVIAALDSPLRLRILLLLQSEPHVVHQLVSALRKSQPLVSQHLRVLKNAGLVDATRAGREVVYKLAAPAIIPIVEALAAITDGDADELAARRAKRGPDLIDASDSFGASAAVGPPPTHTPDTDPGLLPSPTGPVQQRDTPQ